MDDSFREVLPYFKLRYDAPWVYDWLAYAIIGVALAFVVTTVVIALVRRRRWHRHTWQSFRAAARERGLNNSQRDVLEEMARTGKLRNPLLVLSSLTAFDQQVARHLKEHTHGDAREDPKLIKTLYGARDKLGFNAVPEGTALASTREIGSGQRLMVWPAKGGPSGFCQCVVTERDDATIKAVPLLREDDSFLGALETGDRVKVRFWRHDDTEYRFRTRILETDPATTSIALEHSARLERIQKRDFFRVEVKFPFLFFLLNEAEMQEPPMPAGKSRHGTVVDVSAGGLSMLTDEEIPDGHLILIDTDHKGPLPLAGLIGRAIDQQRRGAGFSSRVEFERISPARESELVSAVQQQQLRRVTV